MGIGAVVVLQRQSRRDVHILHEVQLRQQGVRRLLGGDINACVQSGMNAQKTGMVINSSRAVLYASSGEDFKEKAREVAMQTRDAINAARGL